MAEVTASGASQALEFAQGAVEAALRAGATQAEATVSINDRFSTEARDLAITKLEQSTGRSLHVRVFVDGRKATLATSDFERAHVEEAVAAAVSQARHVASDPYAMLPEAGTHDSLGHRDLELFSDDVAEREAQTKLDEALALEARIRTLDSRISNSNGAHVGDTVSTTALVNSNGFAGAYRSTRVHRSVSPVALDGEAKRMGAYGSAARRLLDMENAEAVARTDLMYKSQLGRAARVVNMSELGKALNTLSDPPVKAVFVYNSNPAVVAPNHNDVVRGFMRPDLFTVVHEQFFTDTTTYADIVLPATTFLEHKDLNKAYGHTYLQISNQAIQTLGESRSNTDVFRELAQKMGFTDDCFQQTTDEVIDTTLTKPENQQLPKGWERWMEGITRERLEKEGHVRLNLGEGPFLPFAKGGFATPSGKAELYSESLAAQGMDPVVSFVPAEESRLAEGAKKFPLELLARKADNFLNSSFTNIPSVQKMEHPELLEISTADAQRRNIREGDWVRVFNGRGEVRLRAHVNGAVQPGVVAARLNASRFTPDGNSINVLTSETLTDIGGGATFYSCLVEVEASTEPQRKMNATAKS